jgi:Uma2 family endonuclease
MVQYDPLAYLPTEFDLPDSDDTPVDNELQILIPGLLREILVRLWAERTDWFFGVNMGFYYEPRTPAIVPDGFLSLGVDRFKENRLRLSYVLWREKNIVPQLVLEIVSQTPGSEYTEKMQKYAEIGVLYYVIFNPDFWKRDRHDRFEVYRLENNTYIRLSNQAVWLPEIGLGIGFEPGVYDGWSRDWLYWYDQNGDRHPTPTDLLEQEQQRTQQERERAQQERERAEELQQQLEQLRAELQRRGIDLENL